MLELNGAWLKLAEFIIYAKNRMINVAKNQVKIGLPDKKVKDFKVMHLYQPGAFRLVKRRVQNQFTIVEKISLKHLILIRF